MVPSSTFSGTRWNLSMYWKPRARSGDGRAGESFHFWLKSMIIKRLWWRMSSRLSFFFQFVSVIQGLITAANQLRRLRLHKEEDDMVTEEDSHCVEGVRSILLRRLLASASSAAMSEHAAHLLSALNTDAAAFGDKLNLFHCRNGTFPEVHSHNPLWCGICHTY